MRAISHAQSLPAIGPLSANGPLPNNRDLQNSVLNNSVVEKSGSDDSELREVFTEFVGQTLFGSMLASMRKTVGKPAYMHGGRTEEVFQQQLDQRIVEDMTKASADSLAGPMFQLFTLQRSQ